GVGAHQRLRELLPHRPQQIRARLLQLLAQPARDVHRALDHPAPPRACLRQDFAKMTRSTAITRTRGRRSALAYGSRSTTAAEDNLNRLIHHEQGRYSLAQHMRGSAGGATLYIDTPEGSLDVAYESRAGERFADFVDAAHDL